MQILALSFFLFAFALALVVMGVTLHSYRMKIVSALKGDRSAARASATIIAFPKDSAAVIRQNATTGLSLAA